MHLMRQLSAAAICLACLTGTVAPAAAQAAPPPKKGAAADAKKQKPPAGPLSTWGNYFTTINGALASVALDRSLRPKAPMSNRPVLLWVKVDLRSPKPDGLSDRAELQALSDIEDQLRSQLKAACRAVEAGRITTAGRREFYFYAADDAGFQSTVAATMQQFSAYKPDAGSKADPEWRQYLDSLFPTGEDFQRMSNMDVLGGLLDLGDTLQPVRDVHHWIYFAAAADRQQYAAKAEALGYRVERETEGPQDHPFGLQIARDQSVTPKQIDDAVIELYRMAKQAGAEYDGWDAPVVAPSKKPPPAKKK